MVLHTYRLFTHLSLSLAHTNSLSLKKTTTVSFSLLVHQKTIDKYLYHDSISSTPKYSYKPQSKSHQKSLDLSPRIKFSPDSKPQKYLINRTHLLHTKCLTEVPSEPKSYKLLLSDSKSEDLMGLGKGGVLFAVLGYNVIKCRKALAVEGLEALAGLFSLVCFNCVSFFTLALLVANPIVKDSGEPIVVDLVVKDSEPPVSEAGCLSIIVLGASGDLAKKKTFPALFNLYRQSHEVYIFGYARTKISDDDLRDRIRCTTNILSKLLFRVHNTK